MSKHNFNMKINTIKASEKARRAVEGEMHELGERLGEMSLANAALSGQKRRLEAEVSALRADLDEAGLEVKTLEERTTKAGDDALRLGEELRLEQEHSAGVERMRRQLETQVRDLEGKLEASEMREGREERRVVGRLEERLAEVEEELEGERRAGQEAAREARRWERRAKELAGKVEEGERSGAKWREAVERLEAKARAYRRQLEEAEEIGQGCLNKFRKVQKELEEAEEKI